jgi:hypothetical protein
MSFLALKPRQTWAALAAAALLPASAWAGTVSTGWNEAINGDFSNNGLTPSFVSLALGSNEVRGTTGRDASTLLVDRDYFTITIPEGYFLESMIVMDGTTDIGFGSFIGLMAGNTFPIDPNTFTAEGMLGWTLYDSGNVGGDLLLFMAGPANGSSGFTPPLPAGNYSFWVQETGVGVANYVFQMNVTAVPEPATALSLLGGLALLGAALRRRNAAG